MDAGSESPPSSPKKKAKSKTNMQQPPHSPLSMKALQQVGPQQVKLMLMSEVVQLEDFCIIS